MKKCRPPHIRADEHFEEACNPPAADYRASDEGVKSPLYKGAVLQIRQRLLDFCLGIHHKRSIAGDGFI
jgi:hypothetical protein